ncbi:hypothetical protein ESCNG_20039 [Neisseria gonorrhoeae]|uniref:Uncharacterized protein n=1 Tax=Neisseria gonorrhoeae TaxID=485 RepID=A0AB74ENU3_NEIGO|nr:hypothetical protein ESCNG_20039 [Neisseria gonorrhoeae]SCW11543.1 hypothetical protein ESCNG_20039 [Neisseria gonorrhoeae]SCW13081.1 hypothetical protein ESCNG_20038 [Neisseria gonorrhoeae]
MDKLGVDPAFKYDCQVYTWDKIKNKVV